jgi:hypothetical protein
MLVILATWEAEIGRITFSGQPGQDSISVEKKLGKVAQACHASNSGKHKVRRLWCRLSWAKSETLFPKQSDK